MSLPWMPQGFTGGLKQIGSIERGNFGGSPEQNQESKNVKAQTKEFVFIEQQPSGMKHSQSGFCDPFVPGFVKMQACCQSAVRL